MGKFASRPSLRGETENDAMTLMTQNYTSVTVSYVAEHSAVRYSKPLLG